MLLILGDNGWGLVRSEKKKRQFKYSHDINSIYSLSHGAKISNWPSLMNNVFTLLVFLFLFE